MIHVRVFLSVLMLLVSSVAPASAADDNEDTESVVELFKIAPGRHEEFLQYTAMLDSIYMEVGWPPRQLYVHSTGADWDFLLIQPASMPPEVATAYAKKLDEHNVPSGYDFFVDIRRFYLSHSDTIVSGPTTAEEVLRSLGESRLKRNAQP